MRKFLFFILVFCITTMNAFAAKIPEEVCDFILKNVPQTDIRFDGVIIMPDNTIYLPLFPSLFSDVTTLKIKQTYPENLSLKQKPNVVIFNNDFVLMKVLTDHSGHRTVMHMQNPPLQVRTALLPQDMLVPSGLYIPENIKGIIGNLKIDIKSEDIIRQNVKESFEEFLSQHETIDNQGLIPVLNNKTIFVTTNYSKNIQVVTPPKSTPDYSLAQKSIPIDIEPVQNGKFLLVTSYERGFLDIISVADSRYIKQIAFGTFVDEIVIDEENSKAYVTSPKSSTIFVIDLKTMSLIQKIRINGYCENLLLAGDKIFYVDKMKNDIWAIEIENDYTLKNIGKFPNISSLAFADNKLYIASRTKSRIAVVDYDTLTLLKEFTTSNKPIAMYHYHNALFVLSAQNNIIQVLDPTTGNLVDNISLGTGGFSKNFNRIGDTNYAVITDIKNNIYTIFDMNTQKVVKSYKLNIPIKDVKIANKVELFD